MQVVGHAGLLQEWQRFPDILLANIGKVVDTCARRASLQ